MVKQDRGEKHPKKKPHKKHQPISMHPLDPDEALKAFMEVDPEAVEKRLEKEKLERKEKKEKPN